RSPCRQIISRRGLHECRQLSCGFEIWQSGLRLLQSGSQSGGFCLPAAFMSRCVSAASDWLGALCPALNRHRVATNSDLPAILAWPAAAAVAGAPDSPAGSGAAGPLHQAGRLYLPIRLHRATPATLPATATVTPTAPAGPSPADRATCLSLPQNNTRGSHCQFCSPLHAGDARSGQACLPCSQVCNGHSRATLRAAAREQCSRGNYRLGFNRLLPCKPCQCNGHSDFCLPDTGQGCDCQNNTRTSCTDRDQRCREQQCAVCADFYSGKPTDGRQCYHKMGVNNYFCLDYRHSQKACGVPDPPATLPTGRTLFFQVNPGFLNIDVRLFVDIIRGAADLYLALSDRTFVVNNTVDANGFWSNLRQRCQGQPDGRRRRRSVVSDPPVLSDRVLEVSANPYLTYVSLPVSGSILIVRNATRRVLITIPCQSYEFSLNKFYLVVQGVSTDVNVSGIVFFRQDQNHINLLVFFSMFFSCFFLLFGLVVLAWKARQAHSRRDGERDEAVELATPSGDVHRRTASSRSPSSTTNLGVGGGLGSFRIVGDDNPAEAGLLAADELMMRLMMHEFADEAAPLCRAKTAPDRGSTRAPIRGQKEPPGWGWGSWMSTVHRAAAWPALPAAPVTSGSRHTGFTSPAWLLSVVAHDCRSRSLRCLATRRLCAWRAFQASTTRPNRRKKQEKNHGEEHQQVDVVLVLTEEHNARHVDVCGDSLHYQVEFVQRELVALARNGDEDAPGGISHNQDAARHRQAHHCRPSVRLARIEIRAHGALLLAAALVAVCAQLVLVLFWQSQPCPVSGRQKSECPLHWQGLQGSRRLKPSGHTPRVPVAHTWLQGRPRLARAASRACSGEQKLAVAAGGCCVWQDRQVARSAATDSAAVGVTVAVAQATSQVS
uniref:Laminin EGF-like domain-containing protein n=1 Tax=Macrostomum lignano TaxID=282301 RepID=A0A1I8JM77_9PLAT